MFGIFLSERSNRNDVGMSCFKSESTSLLIEFVTSEVLHRNVK